uniref:BLOC-1-related complex subunit 7 n=1 Tax=Trichuris muris TaxID=70415 RepID=A0A5S6QEP5_TRIMR
MSSLNVDHVDKDLEQRCRRACEDASECLHLMAHEPSLGLYRIQEHARKSIISLAESKRQTDRSLEMINNAVYDIHTASSGIEAFVSAGSIFKNVFENMRASVHLKLRLDGQIVKQEQISDECRQYSESRNSKSLSPQESFDESDDMLSVSIDSEFRCQEPIQDSLKHGNCSRTSHGCIAFIKNSFVICWGKLQLAALLSHPVAISPVKD